MSPSKKATERYTAFYARLTDNDDDAMSLENQAAMFEEIRAEKGWTAKTFVEEGRHQHGDWDEKKRPKLRALLEAVEAGKVARVVVRDLDRLGRGNVLTNILERWAEAGVEVWEFAGPVEYRTAAGELATTVQAAVGKFELRRTGERIRLAKRSWWRKGVHVGPAPFGYTSQARIARELVGQGVDEHDALTEARRQIPEAPGIQIDRDEAKIVREIFDSYVNRRLGARTIAQELNGRGMLRRGHRWHPQTVRKVLRDPKVAGWVTFDDKAYQAKQRHSKKPIHLQEFADGKHEAIIDRGLWKKAQAILDGRGQRIGNSRKCTRCFPLSGVVTDIHGHPMKGKSQRKGGSKGRWAYYMCRRRTEMGNDPEVGGCDAPSINADRAEEAVREALGQILGSSDHVVAVYEAAKKKLAKEAPEKRQEVKAIDKEIAGLERERESAFAGLRDVDLDPDSYKVIAERAQELNERIKALREKREEAEQKVVPIKAPKLDKAQVEVFLGALRKKLSADPIKFGELVHLLKEHHDMTITVLDAYRVKVSLRLDHGAVSGQKQRGRATATVEPNIPLVLTGEAGARPLSAAEWADEENKKGHYCACGCGQKIEVEAWHRAPSKGIPEFIQGHSKMSMAEFVRQLNRDGYLTVTQAANELGISEHSLRTAEANGWITTGRKRWGTRQPMRVYRKTDIPHVRVRMQEAGFRGFNGDVLTTREMAEALGVCESTLRRWEKRGLIPAPRRDSAGRRMWRCES